MLKLGRTTNGEKFTPEETKTLPLEDVKKMIESQLPGAFSKKSPAKKPGAKSKTATVKKTAKKKK